MYKYKLMSVRTIDKLNIRVYFFHIQYSYSYKTVRRKNENQKYRPFCYHYSKY